MREAKELLRWLPFIHSSVSGRSYPLLLDALFLVVEGDEVVDDFFKDFGNAATSGVPLRQVANGLVEYNFEKEIPIEVFKDLSMAVLVHIPYDANDLNQKFLGDYLGKPGTDYAALQSLQKVFIPIESKDVCGVSVQVGAQNLEEEFPYLCFLVLSQVRQK